MRINIRKNGSITNRLVLLYTLSTLILLMLVGGIVYEILVDSFVTGCEQYMRDEIYIIKGLLKKHNNLSSLAQEVNGVPAELSNASYHYYIRVYNDNNNALLETPNMNRLLSKISFPAIVKNDTISNFTKVNILGKKYLLVSAVIQYATDKIPNLYMQMALDMSFQNELIKSLLGKLIIFIVFSTCIIIILGYMIAKKGLHSLFEISKFTKDITPSKLATRLVAENWPSELKPIVASINHMLSNIEDSFNRLSSCTAEVAHEFRTPIMNLMIQSETILSNPRTIAEYREVLESNLEEFQYLTYLIQNILFLARSEDQRLIINKTDIDIKAELIRICEFYKLLASEKFINISLEGENIIFAVDQVLFERAISKILENAIQYTQNNGNIYIKLTAIKNDSIRISITDTGIGIAKEQIPYVFQRFYRINNNVNSQSRGIGLGLSIAKSIMELHKGQIFLKSELEKGTQVDLIFINNGT